VDLLLTHLRKLVEGQGMSLEVSAEAKEFVAEQGYDADYGARPMKRAIQRLVENPLSSALLRAGSWRAIPSRWIWPTGAWCSPSSPVRL